MADLIREIVADDKSHVTAVTFSDDGSSLLNSGFDTTIKIWDTNDFSLRMRLEGHANCANVLLPGADSASLMSASSDATVRMWDLETGAETRKLKPHSQPIVRLRILGDGDRIVTASYDKSIRITSLASGEVVGRIRGKGRELGHIEFLESGTVLMSGGIHPDFSFWSIPSGEALGVLPAHNGGVASMKLLRDGQSLLSIGFDGEVKRWRRGKDFRDWNDVVLHKLVEKGYYFSAVSPSEERIAVCINHGIVVLDTRDGKIIDEIRVTPKSLSSPAYSPDGSFLAAAAADRKIRIWSVG